jgi:hypothetical protein
MIIDRANSHRQCGCSYRDKQPVSLKHLEAALAAHRSYHEHRHTKHD